MATIRSIAASVNIEISLNNTIDYIIAIDKDITSWVFNDSFVNNTI